MRVPSRQISQPPMSSLQRGRILVVDFAASAGADALLELLIGFGFAASLALDRADLCLKLLTWSPDLVVVDGDPIFNETTELENLIRSSSPAALSVIFMCQRPPPGNLCARVLQKPIRFSELLSAIHDTLADRAPSAAAKHETEPTEPS